MQFIPQVLGWRILAVEALLTVSTICFGFSFSQSDTVYVSANCGGEGCLNAAVKSATQAGKLSQTVFKLEANSRYVLDSTIVVPPGERLTIVGPNPGSTQPTAPPMICWSSSAGVNTNYNFYCYGDIYLRNVWLLYANTEGQQTPTSLQIVEDPADHSNIGVFDAVIFDYSSIPFNASGAVGISATHFKGTFKNSYFRNCTDKFYRYYGRAVSYPYNTYGSHIDSLSFENCTFANMGHVYSQESGNYADVVRFNHCTFLNVIMYSVESGWWNRLSVTNSIFLNTHVYGDIPAQHYSLPNPFDTLYGGTLRIDSVARFYFSVPFADQDRRILFANSSYATQRWMSDWMRDSPRSVEFRQLGIYDQIPAPQPMLSPGTRMFFDSSDSQGKKLFPYMNRANLYDSTDPGFILPPTDTSAIKSFLYKKWFVNPSDTEMLWAWKPQNSIGRLWPLEENLAYTNETVITAGMGDFPLGDLYRWWPEKYQQWEAQSASEKVRIDTWLATGVDPGVSSPPEPPSSQIDTVYVSVNCGVEACLNEAIRTATHAGKLSRTVFKLDSNSRYVLDSTIVVPYGERLTIVGAEPGTSQETAPPMICWSSNPGIITNYNFYCSGDIYLKNVWLYYANTDGQQQPSSLQIADDERIDSINVGVFEGVIFDYSGTTYNNSGAVGVSTGHFRGTFKNCYFRNGTDKLSRDYGRAVSFPSGMSGAHIDSLSFENCTFANLGTVYAQENGNYADVVRFNHCTFLNVIRYALGSGWWSKLSVTNSIFVNTYTFGHVPARFYELQNFNDDSDGGTFRIDSVAAIYGRFYFFLPFEDQDRRILFANSSYITQPWLSIWMRENPISARLIQLGDTYPVPVPQSMLSPITVRFFDSADSQGKKFFPYMNRANLYDSADPHFIFPPTNGDALQLFLQRRWFGSSADPNVPWAWRPQNSLNRLWPLEENLVYTNSTLQIAGMGGFPLGDLYRWWPEQYHQWKSQSASEDARIDAWLTTGADPGIVSVLDLEGDNLPSRFALCQNYPNPFNPMTVISFQLPVDSWVTLKVYDLLGREVALLVSNQMRAGSHNVQWDARQTNGRQTSGVPSGVYFYRLIAGSFVQTKKLQLLK